MVEKKIEKTKRDEQGARIRGRDKAIRFWCVYATFFLFNGFNHLKKYLLRIDIYCKHFHNIIFVEWYGFCVFFFFGKKFYFDAIQFGNPFHFLKM